MGSKDKNLKRIE